MPPPAAVERGFLPGRPRPGGPADLLIVECSVRCRDSSREQNPCSHSESSALPRAMHADERSACMAVGSSAETRSLGLHHRTHRATLAAPTAGICCPRGGCRGKSLTRQAGTRRRRAARPTAGAADDRGREGRRILSRQAAGSTPRRAGSHAAGCHGILARLRPGERPDSIGHMAGGTRQGAQAGRAHGLPA